MATESCPRCGEKAITQTGHCVFCGAVVIARATVPSGKGYEKSMRTYNSVSALFLVFGILYIVLAAVGTIMTKSPMLGMLVAGVLTLIQAILLLKNNDWMRSITKVFCMIRLAIFLLMFLVLIPYFIHFKGVGFVFAAVFLVDIYCLVLMIRTIDDVYFA